VRHWMTLNEPQCSIGLGHQTGTHAPGLKLSLRQALQASHHTLLAHGKGVQAIRAASKAPCQVGFAPVGIVCVPASDRDEDIAAARQATFAIRDAGIFNNTWWSDPVFLGRYPEDGLKVMPAAGFLRREHLPGPDGPRGGWRIRDRPAPARPPADGLPLERRAPVPLLGAEVPL